MGVPKFFRYISERYPCLSEIVKEYQIPEFDNLYLDMNGIIHMCSHPDDSNPHFRITEEQIFKDIFHYLEVLFRMIHPRKLFFLAIDGVAPRAKMNQQRGRRFRSAKDAADLEEKAKQKGEDLPSEKRFDSNCITPGTVFMDRLHNQLKYFIVNKISTEKLWQNCKIILSGHETPGEGEHKIMDYIRYLRSQPGYDPNTRHCLYGLDADLIMLGLCTHEPHFSLLREEVKFGKKAKRTNVPEQIRFYLLHLSLMREYLELEFISLKNNLPFEFDLENIIDDWVLMGFLVGNDFIPHLPNLHIHSGALPILYKAYMKVLPQLDGYINEGGKLNLERFAIFLDELSSIDTDAFQECYADLKYFESKTGRSANSPIKSKTLEPFFESSTPANSDLADLIKNTEDIFLDETDQSDETDTEDFFQSEFKQHKTDYYMNKLDYAKVTPEVLRSQAEGYVRAIQWNLNYYYNGCCSWSWYYPHHYAPYISDVKNFKDIQFKFELGRPFLPFQQLLAVLPAASKDLLPGAYQKLMIDESSPIVKYYPNDFQTDLNGKRQEWEAVVLIPFIEEKELLDAMKNCDKNLSDDERKRNSHGPMLVYEHSLISKGSYNAPDYFPTISNNFTNLQELTIEEIRVPVEKLIKGRYPGAKFDVYFPGFPTFKHLKYTGELKNNGVRVFDQPSRGDNMIISIIESDTNILIENLVDKLLGRILYVNWPHLTEAKVITISNSKLRYELTNDQISTDEKYHVIENTGELFSVWKSAIRGASESYSNRLGIDIGPTEILIHALPLSGRSYVFGQNGKFTLNKQWSNVAVTYPYQSVVQDIAVYDPNFIQYKDIKEIYPVDGICFMLGIPYYGYEGKVVDYSEVQQTGRIKVQISVNVEPDFSEVQQLDQNLAVQYLSGSNAAQRLAISPHLLSRITGTVFIIPGDKQPYIPDNIQRTNIGLNLKSKKRNEEIPGYTKMGNNNNWLYSSKAIQLIRDYMEYCPELFEYMAEHTGNDMFFEAEIFPNNVGEDKIKELSAWLKKQPYNSIERQVWGSKLLDPEVIKALEECVDNHLSTNKRCKSVTMQVKPRLLFMPELNMGLLAPDAKAIFMLYDRVVNVRESNTVPIGLKGTIIGIHEIQSNTGTKNTKDSVMFDILFDKEFPGGMNLNCSKNRAYRASEYSLLNISHGFRLEEIKKGNNSFLQDTKQSINSSRRVVNPQSSNSAFAKWPSNTASSMDKRSSYQIRCNYPAQTVNRNERIISEPVSSSTLPREAGPPVFKQERKKQAESKSGVAEFQAIWNELHQLGKRKNTEKDLQVRPITLETTKNNIVSKIEQSSSSKQHISAQLLNIENRKAQTDVNQSYTPKPANKSVSNKEIPDSTEFLKMMLKINNDQSCDETSNKINKSQEHENSKPIAIADLFERAKKESIRPIPPQSLPLPVQQQQVSSQKSFVVELLRAYQQFGVGLPRYNYRTDINGKIQAQLYLPNGKSIYGRPGITREQASEFVAEMVLKDGLLFSKDDKKPVQFNSNLPQPPQQWFQRNMFMNTSPRKNFNPGFNKSNSRNYNFGSESYSDNFMRRDNLSSSMQLNHNNSDLANKMNTPDKQFNKNSSLNPVVSPFVPLQAIKQQRNRTLSNSDKTTNKNTQSQQKQQSSPKKQNNKKMITDSNITKEKTIDSEQKIIEEREIKPAAQKRVRKSRIAANFTGGKF